jgi:hypothetical protein
VERYPGAKIAWDCGGLPKELERAFRFNHHFVSPLIPLSLKRVAVAFAEGE